MKYPKTFLATLLVVASGVVAIAIWLHPNWRAGLKIAKLEIKDGEAFVGGECPGYFSYDTFTDETHHRIMEDIYARACRHLEALSGGARPQTYAWEDGMGYPGMTTVLQLERSYFAVTAFVGNDSDSVSVRSELGQYGGPVVRGPAPKVRTLQSWTLTEEFRSTEWSSR